MSRAALLLLFPFAPLLSALIVIAVRHLARRDLSLTALRLSAVMQWAIGLDLFVLFPPGAGEYRFAVSAMPYAIEFAFESSRLPFLAAYLAPLGFALGRFERVATPELRTILLLYLGGCSGLLVTGDIFNFFVFYELMIMAAYVLVGARGRYYASIKYMLFGAVSSLFLLAGIIAFYATGAELGIPFAPEFYARPVSHQAWVYLFFSTAFFIKSALFPVFGWVATCHAATVPVVSGFLGSYTVFMGIFGLYQRVLRPAALTGFAPAFRWLEVLSLLTMVFPAMAVFVERDFKRCVAGSTVVTIGFVGLLLARGYTESALGYVAVHGVYKAWMFHLADDLLVEEASIRGRRATLFALAAAVWMASGFFPAIIWFLKTDLMEAHRGIHAAALLSSALVAGGFLKFCYRPSNEAPRTLMPWIGLLMLAVVAFWIPWRRPITTVKVMTELATLCAVLYAAARLRRPEGQWRFAGPSFRWPNLNVELLMPFLLFASGLAFFVETLLR